MINLMKFNPFRRSAIPPTWTKVNETEGIVICNEELKLAHTLAALDLLEDERISEWAEIRRAFYANDFYPVSFILYCPEFGKFVLNCRNTGKDDVPAFEENYQPWKYELLF